MSTIHRRQFLKIMMAGGAAAALPSSLFFPACSSQKEPPSYIIFLTDDLGYGDLGCYGNPINKTPNIDKLASEGMRFTDCHSAGTVCSPSRAGLLTGRHPYRLGFYYILAQDVHLRREEKTISRLLNETGYDTCFAGKWHLSDFDSPEKNQPTPADHGFDHWYGTVLNAFDGPENPEKFFRNGERLDEQNGWYCDLIVEEAINWLKNRPDPDKPFFLFLCSHEPHTPVRPPEKYSSMYDSEETDQLEEKIRYGQVPRRKDKDIDDNKKYYYGTVTQLDAAFGRLMEAVDELELRDNTIVFFTSDNGPEYPVNFMESGGKWDDPLRDRCFGTPGPLRGMKRFTYEGGHRVPGIARWPGRIEAGSVCNDLVNGTDFLPTLCELSKIPVPTDRVLDGISFLPVLSGNPLPRKEPVVWNFPIHEYNFMPHISMRDGDYIIMAKYSARQEGQSRISWIKTAELRDFELYNIKNDIGQTQNLIDKEPELFQALSAKLMAKWKNIQADAYVWDEWE